MGSATEEKDIGLVAKKLNEAFKDQRVKSHGFELNGPVSVATKNAKGEYRTVSIFDGKYGVSSAYMGKKDNIIIAFVPKLPVSEYKFIEMDLQKAINSFGADFEDFIINIFQSKSESEVPMINTLTQIKDDLKNKQMENLNWGMY